MSVVDIPVLLLSGTFLGVVLSYFLLRSNIFKTEQERKAELAAMEGSSYRHEEGLKLTVEDIHIMDPHLPYTDEEKRRKQVQLAKYVPFISKSPNAIVAIKTNNPDRTPDIYDLCLFSHYRINLSYMDGIDGVRPTNDSNPVWNMREFEKGEYVLYVSECNYTAINYWLRIMTKTIFKAYQQRRAFENGELEISKLRSSVSNYEDIEEEVEEIKKHNEKTLKERDNQGRRATYPEDILAEFRRRGEELKEELQDRSG